MAVLLHNELDMLKRKLLALSSSVEQSVNLAVKAVADRDANLAKKVITGDEEIDLKEVEVEEDCLKILALHQPVAIDLRVVIATLKINNDLERIGDLASNIAHRAIYLTQRKPVEIPFDYGKMTEGVRTMLREALNAFILLDSTLAHHVCSSDDEVDALNRQMYNQVYYAIQSSPDLVEPMIHYLSICRNLERIADYATNIAEDVIYMIEGRIVRHSQEVR